MATDNKAQGAILIEPSLDWTSTAKIKKLSVFQPYVKVKDEEIAEGDRATLLSEARALKGYDTVGRPTNGIIAKPDTHALVQVLDSNGRVLSCFNNINMHNQTEKGREALLHSSGYYLADRQAYDPGEFSMFGNMFENLGKLNPFAKKEPEKKNTDIPPGHNLSPAWTDWILQSVHESRVEKTQVVETFGDSYFYVFGQRPRSIAFSGLLMNTQDYNWRSIFWENWDQFFRATKLVEKGAMLYIHWDDIIVAGYPVNAMCNEVADSPNAMRFSFNLFVTDYINVSAKSGFLSQRYMRVAQLRGGSGLGYINKKKGWTLLGGEAFDPKAYNYRKTDGVGGWDSKGGGLFGLEGALGLRRYDGAQFQKFSLTESVLSGPGLASWTQRMAFDTYLDRDNAFLQSNFGKSLYRNLGYLVSGAMAAQLAGRGNDPQASIRRQLMYNSMFRQISTDLAVSAAQDVTNFVEDTLDVRRGEIDNWLNWWETWNDASFFGENPADDNGGETPDSDGIKYTNISSMLKSWIAPKFGYKGEEYVGSDGVKRSYGALEGGVTVNTVPGAVTEDI